ncbi:hypothetical protein HZB07_00085 [Candidatus Saganbacteria bacterium]|nr:hypothetical protein [Candidatus Saganbacteria bacterium]
MVARFGFEAVAKLLCDQSYKNGKMTDEIYAYLLPAVVRLFPDRGAIYPQDKQACCHSLFRVGQKLFKAAPRAMTALPAFARFVSKEADLDPDVNHSLGQRLANLENVVDPVWESSFFAIGLGRLALLAVNLDELDPCQAGSLANIMIAKGAFLSKSDKKLSWSVIQDILPDICSKAILAELLENLPAWEDNPQILRGFGQLLYEETASKSGLSCKELADLIIEIIISQVQSYFVYLADAIRTDLIEVRCMLLCQFIGNRRIDLRIRMKVLADYTELLQVDAEAKAGLAMNSRLYSLTTKDLARILWAANNKGLPAGQLGNQEMKAKLIAAGYKEALWATGVDLTVNLSEGLTPVDRKRQVLSATFELVEIALQLGIDKIEDHPLTLDYAASLDSHQQAKRFVNIIIQTPNDQTNLREWLGHILEIVKNLENQPILEAVLAKTFRATIKKDFFTEVNTGVDVPGCFDPRGLHREMPYVHGTEVQSGFLQVFNDRGHQVANAVLLYSPEGIYVYQGFNSTGYNMDKVFALALRNVVH